MYKINAENDPDFYSKGIILKIDLNKEKRSIKSLITKSNYKIRVLNKDISLEKQKINELDFLQDDILEEGENISNFSLKRIEVKGFKIISKKFHNFNEKLKKIKRKTNLSESIYFDQISDTVKITGINDITQFDRNLKNIKMLYIFNYILISFGILITFSQFYQLGIIFFFLGLISNILYIPWRIVFNNNNFEINTEFRFEIDKRVIEIIQETKESIKVKLNKYSKELEKEKTENEKFKKKFNLLNKRINNVELELKKDFIKFSKIEKGVKWPDNSPYWSIRKEEVLKRDKFTCRKCGKKDEGMKILHKVPMWKFRLYHDSDKISNLITLCEECHIREYTSQISRRFQNYKYSIGEYLPLDEIFSSSKTTIIRKSKPKGQPTENQCMVCRKYIYSKENYIVCPYCTGYAHTPELLEWLKTKTICPKCRKPLNKENIIIISENEE